jgi:putative PIN family toxin of toxin-antitoxin system
MLKAESLPAAVLDLATSRKVQMFVSTAILAEYEDVLNRDYLKLSPARVKAVLTLIRRSSKLAVPNHMVTWSKDVSDNRILECAEDAAADYLITGNLKHFPKEWKSTKIATAREFLADILPFKLS